MKNSDMIPVAMQTTNEPKPLTVAFDENELELSLTARFERVAQMHPDALAVKTARVGWRYGELNRRANQVARSVRQLGQQGKPVTLVFEHDAAVILAMLAVLKAGKTYVVLNPDDPDALLQQQLQEIGPGLLLSDSNSSAVADSLAQDSFSSLNLDQLELDAPTDNLPPLAQADSVATVFFTSGSTGRPKGVMRTHRQILFRVWSEIQDSHPAINDAVAHLFLNNAAASSNDAFLTLLTGATLCPYNLRKNTIEHWRTWLYDERIRYLHPSVASYRQLTDTYNDALDLPFIRCLGLGGQKLYPQDIERFKTSFPSTCQLIYRFSTSETGIITRRRIDHDTSVALDDEVSIGHPASAKRVFIADQQGNELAHGEVGEIRVQSRYLSPGYWGNPELTDARFIEDPADLAAAIYCTGDKGRIRSDGSLEHHGRIDFMVKINGFRVELEAIDSALMKIPGIRDAVVIAQELANSSHRLIAYLVFNKDGLKTRNISEIRETLTGYLPAHMMPAQFIELDSMPLTTTGKPDRKALPAPDNERSAVSVPYARPTTPFEEILCEIWREVLEYELVGIHDPFVDLGGNSLQALSISTRVQQRFAISIPTATLYHSNTVAEMALLVLNSLLEQQSVSALNRGRSSE